MLLGFNVDGALSNVLCSGTAGSWFPEIQLHPGITCKNCSLKSFPYPSDLCQEGPSMHRSPCWYKKDGDSSSLPSCCVSRMLWWQEVAREQKLPASHEQQPWKAQGKKDNRAGNCKQKQEWENGTALSLTPAFHSKSPHLSETSEEPQGCGTNPAEGEQGSFIWYKWFPEQH